MPRTTLRCCRCGFETDRMSTYGTHVARKTPCPAKLQDVAATLDNVVRVPGGGGGGSGGSGGSGGVTATECNNVTVNNNISNSHNTTTNNNHNMTIVIQNRGVHPIDREDLGHITADMWDQIRRLAGLDPECAVRVLVSLINCNPAHPHNMNTYMPADESKPAAVFHNASSQGWQDWCTVDRHLAVKWMIDGRASQLQDYVEDHGSSGQDMSKFDAFIDRKDTPEALAKSIMALAVDNSRLMDAARRAPPQDGLRDFPFSRRALARMQGREDMA